MLSAYEFAKHYHMVLAQRLWLWKPTDATSKTQTCTTQH